METRSRFIRTESGKTTPRCLLAINPHVYLTLLASSSRRSNSLGSSGSSLLLDEQFGFRTRHITTLQLPRLVERLNRNFDEKRQTGSVFLDVAKAFDNEWVKGLLYKVTILIFSSYLVNTMSSYVHCGTFQTFFHSAPSTRRGMRAGVAHGGLISPMLFSLYGNDIHATSRHVESAQFADGTTLAARFCSLLLLVGVGIARYPGVTLDTQLTLAVHTNQAGQKTGQGLGVLGPLLNRRSGLSFGKNVLLHKQLIRPTMDCACPVRRSAARSHVWKVQVLQSECLRIATLAPGFVSDRQIHEDLGIPLFAENIMALT
jgi:hypothetical protein